MENPNYYYLNYQGEWPLNLESVLIDSHAALGVEEMALEEAEVDAILGEASFCGGDLPEELMDKLELAQTERPKKIFFEDFVDAKKAMIFLNQNFPAATVKITTKKNQDWQSNWQQYYKKVELLGGRIAIVPEWEKNHDGHELSIRIIPGQGFGTGTHETTQLCLEWILDLKFSRVLDFGCGSGILGIGTQLLMKEAHCDYYDIDTNALSNCCDNIKLNEIVNNFKIYEPKEKIKLNFNKYDLIFANILAPVLKEESKLLKSLKSPILILSGLLQDQVEGVMSFYNDLYEIKGMKQRGDWISLLLSLK